MLAKLLDLLVLALKIAGESDLFLGIFVVLEGFSLIFAPSLFPIFIVLSILIAFACTIEWFLKVIRNHDHSLWNNLQHILVVIILIALIIYCALLIFDDLFRLNVDRVSVCVTTVADGLKNLIRTLKYEKRRKPRLLLIIFSLIYINYGITYIFLGGETNVFTTTMHGYVFIFCGLTNIWLALGTGKPKKKKSKTREKAPA